jgi:hypothetical protein
MALLSNAESGAQSRKIIFRSPKKLAFCPRWNGDAPSDGREVTGECSSGKNRGQAGCLRTATAGEHGLWAAGDLLRNSPVTARHPNW